ncbi:MAG: hypothetical protein JWP61_1450 [Friedmanniella sp.]|nr:hypothetical protein [Friedmanniella sp.]
MSSAGDLLDQASAMLAAPTAHSNRMACWIARAALEAAVDELLDARQCQAPEACMRSRLSVLQVAYLDDPALVVQAEYAWHNLSSVCHHHAFELTPSGPEVRHLIDVAAGLTPER